MIGNITLNEQNLKFEMIKEINEMEELLASISLRDQFGYLMRDCYLTVDEVSCMIPSDFSKEIKIPKAKRVILGAKSLLSKRSNKTSYSNGLRFKELGEFCIHKGLIGMYEQLADAGYETFNDLRTFVKGDMPIKPQEKERVFEKKLGDFFITINEEQINPGINTEKKNDNQFKSEETMKNEPSSSNKKDEKVKLDKQKIIEEKNNYNAKLKDILSGFGGPSVKGVMEPLINKVVVEDEPVKIVITDEDKKKYNSLMLNSCQMGNIESVREYVNKGADDYNKALSCASSGGHLKLIDYFLSLNKKLDIRSACICASKSGNMNALKKLLLIEPEHRDVCLEAAKKHKHKNLIHFLSSQFTEDLKEEEDTLTLRKINKLCLNYAQVGNLGILKDFVEKGANNFTKIACCAASGGQLAIIDYIIQKSEIDFNEVVETAAKSGCLEAIKTWGHNANSFSLGKALETAYLRNNEDMAYIIRLLQRDIEKVHNLLSVIKSNNTMNELEDIAYLVKNRVWALKDCSRYEKVFFPIRHNWNKLSMEKMFSPDKLKTSLERVAEIKKRNHNDELSSQLIAYSKRISKLVLFNELCRNYDQFKHFDDLYSYCLSSAEKCCRNYNISFYAANRRMGSMFLLYKF